ncbi:hypothetical protein [Saccharothrix texasensis]|uniref:Uncharacterized protein n=1 Tax=Saccharothrix texasensis TaxID=103734 RepID=A0A3N1GXL1_9PSEU|nr:hypothetical protein [Saccharothrix texasensis]ROP34967.1 hypothetical protein EDD40_0180 [Saccharothrix texasensis]
MKIQTGWSLYAQDQDRPELLSLITTGHQEVEKDTGRMIEQYKMWSSDLTDEELGKVITLLARGNVFAQNIAKDLRLELAERPARAEQRRLNLQLRRDELARTEERLLRQGLDQLGGAGDTWDGRRDRITAWWREVKVAELAETWAAALAGDRMTARQVNNESVLGGDFDIRNNHHRLDRAWDRKITLDRTLNGVRKRLDPRHFDDPGTGRNRKGELGLHDLSGSLLHGTRVPLSIYAQLKPYANATVVFMPAPTERDAQIFNAIQSLKTVTEGDVKLMREMRNRFTRLRLAQATDMHTYLLNLNEVRDGEPVVRYGHSGLIRRAGQKTEVNVDDIDIATRRTNALEHHVVLAQDGGQVVNEVVIVYREHASALFPVFAEWNKAKSHFTVLNRDTGAPTKAHITDDGKWVG